jgi:hypothetical protein
VTSASLVCTSARSREVWPGKASDGALSGLFFGLFFRAPDLHRVGTVMRDHDEEDPKKPHPVWSLKKRANPAEASEAVPIRKDHDRDRHRHVV